MNGARMSDPRIAMVGAGYDAMADTWESREPAARRRLTGVDLSEEQLRRARGRVPDAEFVHGDLTTIEFDEPGGHFLATLGAKDLGDWRGEWLGVPMFFSGHDPETNRRCCTTPAWRSCATSR